MPYTSLEYLRRRYDEGEREYAFSAGSREEFERWKQAARRRLWEITGLTLCREADPSPRLVETEAAFGGVREYRTLQMEPGVEMPFWLYRPARPNGAAVIVPHGHGGGKEGNLRLMTDGRPYLELLTEQGYTVACPDARGSGDRLEFPQRNGEDDKNNSHRELQQAVLGFGGSVLGLMLWDLMRLTDYLLTLPEVSAGRIGCTGMSGGGQQTLWLAAMDDRISAAVTGGYFYGVRDSLVMLPQNCACNFVPRFWNTMDMGDLGAMIAPRPLMVESGRKDHLNGERGLDNVYPQVKTALRAYELWDAADRLVHSVHEGAHQWSGAGVVSFLNRRLAEEKAK